MKHALLAIAFVLTSGCITMPDANESSFEEGEAALPKGTTVILATMTEMAHSGQGGVTAVPQHNVSAPSSCTIFREGRAYAQDSCVVREGGDHMVAAPWHVEARFAASGYPIDDSRRWSEKSIEAYYEGAQVMGTWDGARDYHPKHQRVIE